MIEFKSIVRQTQKFLSTLFQNVTVDEETEKLSKNRKFLSIIKSARTQKGKGLSSQEMRRWVETELSEK